MLNVNITQYYTIFRRYYIYSVQINTQFDNVQFLKRQLELSYFEF